MHSSDDANHDSKHHSNHGNPHNHPISAHGHGISKDGESQKAPYPPIRLVAWETTRRRNLACVHCRVTLKIMFMRMSLPQMRPYGLWIR